MRQMSGGKCAFMFLLGLVIGFFAGAAVTFCIIAVAFLYSGRDCGKDWWKEENE